MQISRVVLIFYKNLRYLVAFIQIATTFLLHNIYIFNSLRSLDEGPNFSHIVLCKAPDQSFIQTKS